MRRPAVKRFRAGAWAHHSPALLAAPVLLAGVVLAVGGCSSARPAGHPASGPASTGGPADNGAPADSGVLTGNIDLCSGLPVTMLPPDDRPPKLFSAAATVVLLHGPVHWQAARAGTERLVFPSAVVAREQVSRNQPYRFAGVRPGRYVVRAWYAGGNAWTFRDMTLRPGGAVHADLPNLCK
jgi:hypothetical protein